MAGAHFDSWIAGDGASDNGAGSMVVMEAARILRQLGVRPKRTIRFALVGRRGARACSAAALTSSSTWSDRPTPAGMDGMTAYYSWGSRYPIVEAAGLRRAQGLFQPRQWLGQGPRHLCRGQCRGRAAAHANGCRRSVSMGADAVVASKTGGTDHVFMQAVGLQGYQFIQDPARLREPGPPFEHRHARPYAWRRSAPGVGRHGGDAAGRRQQRQGTAAPAPADPADC